MQRATIIAGLIVAGLAGSLSLFSYGLAMTLAVMCGVAVVAAGLARPGLMTWVALFALYTNLPVVAVNFHGAPALLAVVPVAPQGVPLVHHLLVRRDPVIVDDVLRLMFLFLGVLLLASISAKDRGLALTWITVFLTEGLLIYFVLLNVIRDRVMLRGAIWALLAAGAFMGATCVYSELTRSYSSDLGGLVQRTTAPDEVPTAETAIRDKLEGTFSTSRRASGPIGEVNRFAQILLVLFPLAYFRFRGERHLTWRLSAALLGGAILAGFLLTYSRSAFMTAVVLIALLTLMGHLRASQFVGFGAVLLVIVLLVPGYRSRIASIGNLRALSPHSRSVEADGATRGRLTEMRAALYAFIDHPLIGVGPGQYARFYSVKYQTNSPGALRYIPQPRRAHSMYLEMAAETGVAGLISFMAIPFAVLAGLWRKRESRRAVDPELANLASACWFAVVSYLVMAVFLHLAFQRYFWLLIALGGVALQLSRSTDTQTVTTPRRQEAPAPVRLQTQS